MKIKFCLSEQIFNAKQNPQGHAQEVVEDLGIKYEKATPQSLFDCWIFEGCYNVPEELPPCIKLLSVRKTHNNSEKKSEHK